MEQPLLPLPGGGCLRPLTEADAPALTAHANDRAVWRNMRDRFPHPYAEADARRFIAFATSSAATQERVYAIEAPTGAVVGVISLLLKADVNRRSAEIGYWLGRAHWGQGLATEAVRTLAAHAFATLDLARLYAVVFDWNPASGRVLEKSGFTREARLRQAITKDGQTVDGLLYARLRADDGAA